MMPLGSPIGSGMGIRNPYNVQIIAERADGARDPRRRHRHRLGRRAGHGARVRRRAARELRRQGQGPRADGARDAARGRGRLRGAPCRPDPAPLHAEASTPDPACPTCAESGLLSPRELAVGPLAHGPGRPRDPVRRPARRRGIERLDRRVGIGSELDRGLADRPDLAPQAALPGSAELGQDRIAAGLADAGQIAGQSGDPLHVLDREAERLVSLQEAIEHGAPHRAQVRARRSAP